MEALITFKDIAERDFYFSKAKNLAPYRDEKGLPTAGIRMDVPPFLLPTFKLLSDHGYDIRSANGPETRRYVKFDEDNQSLLLEVKLPGQSKWTRIRPSQARSWSEEKDKKDYHTIRLSLASNQPPPR